MKMIRPSLLTATLTGALASLLAFAPGLKAQDRDHDRDQDHDSHTNTNVWPYARAHRAPLLAVVGDVACQPGATEPTGEKAGENCAGDTVQNLVASQAATAKQIENMKPD